MYFAPPQSSAIPGIRDGRFRLDAAHQASQSTGGARRGEETEQVRLLLARPVSRPDLSSMLEIASHVNIASMRAERAKNELAIEQSIRTLAGNLAWQQGLLLLAADLFMQDGGPGELAGNIKLQVGWGGYWKKRSQDRIFALPGLQTWATHEHLAYQPNAHDEFSLELAGLSVLPRHRGKKVARFLTQSWALFVLLYQEELRRRIGKIAYLCANVLTADADGKYPFYEQVVRPLFGGLEYDTVDAYRYARCNARSPILDEFLDARGDQPRASIPCYLLSESLRHDLGKVRDQSIGCQKNLERLGFSRTDKFDVLDGGQYFESSMQRLEETITRRLLGVRCVPENQIGRNAAIFTLAAANRPMPDFRCAQARGVVRGDELWLGEDVFDALELRRQDTVVVLNASASCQETGR
jgi:arginine/ornithine N-succinyltransferase beta subunit